ncbi:MAG: hypothetical protein ILO36_01775 [Abditibacteriota bacterium]|nr:hypothetical protein [Abditibacteriota bacterium]
MKGIYTDAAITRKRLYPAGDVRNYAHLVRKEKWLEKEFRTGYYVDRVQFTEGEIWTDAIQAALDENERVYVPWFANRLYIDKTLYIGSGTTLEVCEGTVISLKPDSNCCMLTNKNFRVSRGVFEFDSPDTDICITGGTWSLTNNGSYGGNGNVSGNVRDSAGTEHKAFSVMSFTNVKGLRLNNITFFDITPFAVYVSGIEDFDIENLKFVKCYRDGVHVCGPASRGRIRNLTGVTGDDFVALNAYDDFGCALSLGKIDHVLVENITSPPGWMWSENRLLAGKFIGDDGKEIDCSVEDCTFRNCRGFHTYKGYLQANLVPPPIERPDRSGHMDNLTFENIFVDYIKPEDYYTVKRSAFEMGTSCSNFTFRNIYFSFPLGDPEYGDWSCVTFGPSFAAFLDSRGFMPTKGVRFENVFHKVGGRYVEADPSLCARTVTAEEDGREIGRGTAEEIYYNEE